MDCYLEDELIFGCHICGSGEHSITFGLEEPRYIPGKEGKAMTIGVGHGTGEVCDLNHHIYIRQEIRWNHYSWRKRLSAIWRILRGRLWNDNEVILGDEQVSILVSRLQYWATLRKWEPTDFRIPKGITGATSDYHGG
jgi:hypothetical protein